MASKLEFGRKKKEIGKNPRSKEREKVRMREGEGNRKIDLASNKAIGSYGATFLQHQRKNSKRFSVLTHCNTGRFVSLLLAVFFYCSNSSGCKKAFRFVEGLNWHMIVF